MTRKQAVSQAISILSDNKENVHIIEKLQEILEELPCASWTQESILDAIENYAIEHNNTLPYAHDLTSEYRLPSNTVIYSKFGMKSIQKFYKKYFQQYKIKNANESPYKNYSKDDFLEIFKNSYMRIKQIFYVKTVTGKMYKQNRNDNEPSLEIIMKNCKCKTYDELLFLAGFKNVYKNLEVNMSISYNDDDKRNDELRTLIQFDNNK